MVKMLGIIKETTTKGGAFDAPLLFFRPMKLLDILTLLDGIAPFDLAEKWDNVGLLVGDAGQEIKKAVISLDPGFDVISKAEETGCDLIITHHPLFIEPLKNLNLKNATALKAGMLLKAGISLVAMHTNLDAAEGGVADVLAQSLGAYRH